MRTIQSERAARRGFAVVAIVTVLAIFAPSPPARAAEPPRRPNLVFILADDLGYGDLGCYGQERIRTPELDRMADEGVRFVSAYAGSTVCAPSRCALMTGLHTGHCRVRGNVRVPLRDADPTVAKTLRDAGYRTALIGKWGLGDAGTTGSPERQGFDEWFGYTDQVHAHDYYPDHLWENGARFELPGNREGARTQYTHDLFAERARAFLRDAVAGARPFFLYLAFTIPHANNERGAATGDGMEVPDLGEYADRDWPVPERAMAAMVSRMDRDVGSLLSILRESGAAENTLVIFSSDNGPHREGGRDPKFFGSSGPLRGIKRAMYDGGIRVPAIAWGERAGARAGSVSKEPWAFWDLLPTAAEMAGVATPTAPDGSPLDGVSILPLLAGGTTDPARRFYWEFHERGFHQAMRRGDWKAVRRDRGPLELYDLATDLGETTDRATEFPEIVREFEREFEEARTPPSPGELP